MVLRRRLRDLAVLAAACAPLALAACEDDNVSVIQPSLAVSPLEVDFGTVEITQDAHRTVSLKNLQAVPVDIESLEIEDDCGGCFVAIDAPKEVLPYRDHPLDLRFRAVRLEVATATVSLRSSDARFPISTLHLIGRGMDTRRPDVAAAPEAVDFGFVPAGGVALASFVVRSTGTNVLLVDAIELDPADAPFRITTSTPTPGNPGRMAPGAQVSVSLRATLPATSTGTVTARVLIRTNVLEEKNVPGRPGVLAVPLRARANLPPVAVVGGAQTVEPWSRATLDGSASHDQDDPPDEPLGYRWTLTQKPGGSTTRIERATSPIASFWVDLTGHYEAELVVTDALGLESEPKTVSIDALPTNAVRIELTWDHPDSDLDLHLLRAGGAFCDCASDCHYRDCGRAPDWFPGTPGANPRLDVDDRSGFGPENINIDGDGPMRVLAPGDYDIYVHYYASNGGVSTWPTQASTATVRVYVFGLLAAELTRTLEQDGDLWKAGVLAWPAQTVTGSDELSSAAICSVF